MRSALVGTIAYILAISGAVAEPDMTGSTIDPKILSEFRQLVIEHGYNCPVAKAMATYPADEYGDVFRLFCKTQPETNTILDFRITVSQKGNLSIRKW